MGGTLELGDLAHERTHGTSRTAHEHRLALLRVTNVCVPTQALFFFICSLLVFLFLLFLTDALKISHLWA